MQKEKPLVGERENLGGEIEGEAEKEEIFKNLRKEGMIERERESEREKIWEEK